MSRIVVGRATVVRAAVLVSLSLLVTTGCALPASDLPARADASSTSEGEVLGYVIDVVQCDGFILVDFPWGRTTLSVSTRDLEHLQAGKTIVFDKNLRPLRLVRPGA